MNDHLRAAQAAGVAPQVGAQGPASLPQALWAWVEEAARSEKPLESEVARILEAIRQDANAPEALRTLAARLHAVLEDQRDPDVLTRGLGWAEAVNMLALLGNLRQAGRGQRVAGFAQALRAFLQGDESAAEKLRQDAEQALAAEDKTTRAFGRGLQALLSGGRDPERLLAGWGESDPLLAAALRLALEEE